MKHRRTHRVIFAAIVCAFMLAPRESAALTGGESYTVTLEAIKSNGTLTSAASSDSLGMSTIAVADADGKISFSFSYIPTSSSYNFLVTTIKDSLGTVVRRSIVPAPAPGTTVNFGVSPMTEAQTEAMLSAMQTAGSDDPVMVLFGGIIIRSGGFTTDDITHLGNIGRLAILGPNGNETAGGFNWYLKNQIGAAKMTLFKASIVSQLASYTSKIKNSVDAASSDSSKDERAEAAAFLSQILIDAAAAADFDVGYINAAMKAASDQVETYLGGDGAGMNEAAVSAMDSVMASNYMKLAAERLRNKYSSALTTLDATSNQIARFNTAITTLSNSLIAAFQTFEEVWENEEAGLDKDEIDAANAVCNAAINAAFTQFMTDSESTDAEIDDMVTAMIAGFQTAGIVDLNAIKDPNDDGDYSDGMFTFRDMSGNVKNWPITMVVPVTWLANTYGNAVVYTRDTIDIPTAAAWIDGDNITPGRQRTTFGAGGYNMPDGMAAIMGLREDVEIIMARKWAGLAAASRDMTTAGYNTMSAADKAAADAYVLAGDLTIFGVGVDDDGAAQDDLDGVNLADFDIIEDLAPYLTGAEVQGVEELFVERLTARAGDIQAAGITAQQQQALVDTAMMPDFN